MVWIKTFMSMEAKNKQKKNHLKGTGAWINHYIDYIFTLPQVTVKKKKDWMK